MKEIYIDYLFSKCYLVGKEDVSDHAVETLISLADIFGIHVVSGYSMASAEMISVAERNINKDVPEAFYAGFPDSVRSLSSGQLLLDQLLHYVQNYGFENFQMPGHSFFEKAAERKRFAEEVKPKFYKIISEEDALVKLQDYISDMLSSTRPLSDFQYSILTAYIRDFDFKITHCNCKDTLIHLIVDTRSVELAPLLSLSDVIRLVEQMQLSYYYSTNIRKLNFRNKDRVFLARILDLIFESGKINVIDCFEKKKLWCGILHHIHYKPVNDEARAFVNGIRGDKNLSVYSGFEALISRGDIIGAAEYLSQNKGKAAVLRNLNYLLSRCKSAEEISAVLDCARSDNIIVLLQLLIQYGNYRTDKSRVFKFTKFNRLKVHCETPEEAEKRKSVIPPPLVKAACEQIRGYLSLACKNKLGKVYVDESMKKVALPIQENTSMSGVGVLPKGTRLPIEDGKKIRAFTYWEKINDIDLSAIGITRDGRELEFSWRSMYELSSSSIVYSGDQTLGYYGGSEYFDVIPSQFRKEYPSCRYIVFCNNVYSSANFSDGLCNAGYMIRDLNDSGEIFEPKTVSSSFRITCDSRFAYLFAIDLDTNEFVWLNISRNSNLNIAGLSSTVFLEDYLNVTNIISLYDLATLMATEIVSNPEDADTVFSDGELKLNEGTDQIRSCDSEKVISLINS